MAHRIKEFSTIGPPRCKQMEKKNKKVGISVPVLARSDVPHAVHRSISSAAAFALANLTS